MLGKWLKMGHGKGFRTFQEQSIQQASVLIYEICVPVEWVIAVSMCVTGCAAVSVCVCVHACRCLLMLTVVCIWVTCVHVYNICLRHKSMYACFTAIQTVCVCIRMFIIQ